MNLLHISREQLISEVYESKKMMYRLMNLPKEVQSYLSISLLPYLSLICDGIDSLFESNGTVFLSDFEDINKISFTKIIGKTRASSKLLTDKRKINQAINILEKDIINFSDQLKKDYSEEEMTYVNIFGQEDLGIYYFKNKPFANTSQLTLYIKSLDSDIMKVGNHLYNLSIQISSCISVFLSNLEGDNLEKLRKEDFITEVCPKDFKYKDYIFSEEIHRNIFNDENDKNISLFLLNTQCQLNFSINILNMLIDDHPLKFRIQFLIYYYSVQALEFAFSAGLSRLDNNQQDTIRKVIDKKNEIFKSNTFRNNLFHYKLSEENIGLTNKDIFESMVEKQTYVNFNELLCIIYNEMSEIEELIEELIY